MDQLKRRKREGDLHPDALYAIVDSHFFFAWLDISEPMDEDTYDEVMAHLITGWEANLLLKRGLEEVRPSKKKRRK